jgi:hypothetical protein
MSWWLMPVILATWGAEIRRIMGSRLAGANSSQDPISKITTTKWTGGVVQTVQHLFWKCKPQSHHKKKKTTKLFNDYAAIYDLWV